MKSQAHARAKPAQDFASALAPSRVLRRKCACGGSPGPSGECAECRKRKLQRRAAGPASGQAPPIVHDVLRSPGAPLDARARADLEPRFGYDFSRVRVHSDAQSARSAEAVNALAYTVGRHVVFAPGRYAPGTSAGRALLAHELSHVDSHEGAAAGPIEIGRSDAPEESMARSAENLAEPGPAEERSSVSEPRVLRRKEAMPDGGASAGGKASSVTCLQPVTGEEIESLLESNVVTVVEYGAEWCHPCKDLQADLIEICKKFRLKPPPAKVRFYSVGIEDKLNEALPETKAFSSVPHLLIYVGSTQRKHLDFRPEYDLLEKLINDQVEYASTSGAWTGFKWGAGIGGVAGLAVGIGLAAAGILTGLGGFLAVLGGGALLGGGVGALIGKLTDDRKRAASARVGFNEAETLIRRRFGRHMPAGGGPLHGARIRPVTQADLRVWNKCRHPEASESYLSSVVGWTDTGPAPPQKIASPDDEPVCGNGQKLEHATLDRPVIYYARDRRDLTILIHEGLHAHAHPNFTAQARNYVNEGAAEYFTRRLADEIGAASDSGYDDETKHIRDLVSVVGEEALQTAYFKGDFSPANAVLGPCGMQRWAQLLQMNSWSGADEVLKARNQDYCGNAVVYPTGLEE